MNRKALKVRFQRRPKLAFAEPVQPDNTLSPVVGAQPLPRSELISKLWNYIRDHGLQDEEKKTIINADDNLRAFFDGKSQVSIFELMSLISAHLMPRTA